MAIDRPVRTSKGQVIGHVAERPRQGIDASSLVGIGATFSSSGSELVAPVTAHVVARLHCA